MRRLELDLVLPSRLNDQPVMYTLAHDFGCAFTILKGRFDERAARVRCRIEGDKRSLDRALGYLATLGAGVRAAPVRRPARRAGSPQLSRSRRVQSHSRSRRAAR